MVSLGVTLALLATLTLLSSTEGVIAPIAQGTKPWNIKGDVLVLDVSSLKYQGNHPMFPTISSADQCQSYCMQVTGCSGWTFCNSKDGCGSGCSEFVARNRQLSVASGANENPTLPNKNWYSMTTIDSFGPWGPTGNCKQSCGAGSDGNWVCRPTGNWPHGMCTLKVVKPTAQPEFYTQNEGEGWISGWIKIPALCSGASPRACQRCLQSLDPARCITCAKDNRLGLSLLEEVTAGNYALQRQDGCGSCFNTSNPGRCTDCLFNNKNCAACATQLPEPGQKLAVLKCIDCSNRYGADYTSSCTSCAALGAKNGAVDMCMACLARASEVACKESSWPPTCWNPTQASTVCATCASTATDYESCVRCVERKPYSESCAGCGTLPDAVKQKKCYDCAKSASSPSTGCYDCAYYLKDPKQTDQCYSCIANPKTTSEGRSWCFGCQNWCSTFESRGKCSACLQTRQDNYMGTCSCSS